MNVVLMGPPGVGKGTQAAGLVQRYGMLHISTGNILRAAVHSGSEFGNQVASVLKAGQLVSDGLMVGLIRECLDQDESRYGWLMDGYPRTVPQAEALHGLLDDLDQTVHAVVVMAVPDEVVVSRLAGRVTCKACGATMNQSVLATGLDSPCPQCDGRSLFVRDDDREETVRERLSVFWQQTNPVVAVLEKMYPVRRVSGLGTPHEVAERLHGVLG